jgi:hypothetical protein
MTPANVTAEMLITTTRLHLAASQVFPNTPGSKQTDHCCQSETNPYQVHPITQHQLTSKNMITKNTTGNPNNAHGNHFGNL